MTVERWTLAYAFKGKVHQTSDKPVGFGDVRQTLLARLAEIEGCGVSDLDTPDSLVEIPRDNGILRVADLFCRQQWAYQRQRLSADGQPHEREEFVLSGAKNDLTVFVSRYRVDRGQPAPEEEQVPRLLALSAHLLDIGDGMRLIPRPWIVREQTSVKPFWDFVRSSERFLSLCVYIEPANGATFDPVDAALKGFGFCHVMTIPHAMIETIRQNKPFKCNCPFEPGTVAFVQPAWCLRRNETHQHLPFERVRDDYLEAFQQEHGIDISPAMSSNQQIFERTHVLTSSTRATPPGLKGFAHVERGIEKILRSKGPDPQVRIAALEAALEQAQADADKARADVSTWQGLCADVEKEQVRLDEALRETDGKLAAAQTEITRLRGLLWDQKPEIALVEIPIPDTYKPMALWCKHHLAGKLVLHPRAVNELKSAQYGDVALVYKSLRLLANEYRDMRLARGDAHVTARRRFSESMSALRLANSVSDKASREYDGYEIEWPLGSGHKQTLDHHLKRGNTMNPVTCLRIYYVWDAESQVVVVGSLPKHLQNHLT